MRKNILILGHNDVTQFVDIYNQYTTLFDPAHYDVTVAYLTGEPNDAVIARTLAPNVVFFNLPKKDLRTLKLKSIQTLLTFCREKQFQMVICHRYKPTYVMMWVSTFCPIPALIFVMHELKTMSAFARKLFITCFDRKNMLYAGVSDAVRDDMRKDLWMLPKERIITLYNMIDIERTASQLLSRTAARTALQLSDDSFVFGNLARLVPNKDHESLIHAFSLIKPDCPNAKLIILGTGELEPRLKEQVHAYGLTADILFPGFLPRGFSYMKAFDCFVLSSTQEAFGRVLLEAMVAKRPLIATRVHGIPEVIGEAGLLIHPKDPLALATAMKASYALSQSDRDAQGEKAYQRAVQTFSLPTFREQFWQLPLAQAIC